MPGYGQNSLGLNAVTQTGTGPIVDLFAPQRTHALQVSATGAPTGVKVTLLGSLDRTNFFVLATWDTGGGQTLGDIVFAVDKPVMQVQCNLVTLTGGTSPTVSARVASSP